jgi:hypothetical protein
MCFWTAIELLGFFFVSQAHFAEFARVGIHVRNLLEARVIITSYNDHVRLLSPEPFVGLAPQSLLGPGSRHCYGIISLIDPNWPDFSVGVIALITPITSV